MSLVPYIKDGDWRSVRQAISKLASIKVGGVSSPTFAGLTLSDLTKGSVLFAGSGGIISQDNANLFWDDSNNRLGIGTVPSYQLDLTKNINLTNTTYANQYGIIYKNGVRFIHNFNYGDNGTVTTIGRNLFIGENAGNLTMGSTAISTYHGSYNTAIGNSPLQYNTTGYQNTAIGNSPLQYNTTGYDNTAIGSFSLQHNTTGYRNLATGSFSLRYNTTGYQNLAIGVFADFYVPSTIITATAVSGSGLEVGNYWYRVSYVLAGDETCLNNEKYVATTSGNQQVDLSGIPTYSGPMTASARKIYRTKVNAESGDAKQSYYLLTTINDNTTTTYSDTTADASLSILPNDPDYSIMLGYNAKAFESNQLVLGSNGTGITHAYLGEGIYATTPVGITLHATGGQGTDNAGGDFTIAGGIGTGIGAGGDIIFQTSAAGGSSGTSANSLSTRMTILGNGNVGIGVATPTDTFEVAGIKSSVVQTMALGVGVTTFAITQNIIELTGDGGTNTIATITGASIGTEITIIFADGNVTITDDNTHAADSVDLSAAFTSADDTVLKLVYNGTSWYEVSRSVN